MIVGSEQSLIAKKLQFWSLFCFWFLVGFGTVPRWDRPDVAHGQMIIRIYIAETNVGLSLIGTGSFESSSLLPFCKVSGVLLARGIIVTFKHERNSYA